MRSRRQRLWMALVLACLVPSCGGVLLILSARSGHRRPPEPPGMVFRVEARPVESPMDQFAVYAVDRDGPAVAVLAPATGESPAALRLYRYPDGRCIEETIGPAAVEAAGSRAWIERRAEASFDLDADGVADRIDSGGPQPLLSVGRPVRRASEYGLVRVRSGRDGSVLFEDLDPLEYEGDDRAVPLGDLDGDGAWELALLHPRMDRSHYDVETWDWLLGARSWVTIVSGSRLTR